MQPDKRKPSTIHSMQQPPFKKMAVDGAIGTMQPMAMTTGSQGAEDRFPTQSSGTGMGQSSAAGQVSVEAFGGRRAPTGSAVLAQAWKEDLDAGHLLASLYQLFGEGVLSFIQPVEMSFFIWASVK